MLKRFPLLILLLFLIYPGQSGFLFSYSPKQDKPKKDKNDVGLGEKIHTNQWSLEFWENLRIVPVKFIGKEKDYLVAQFSSDLMVRQINFKILPEQSHSFLKLSGNWEEEIDAKQFLKEMKKDLWLVIYFAGSENIIYEVHQFKNWISVDSSFPSDPERIAKSNKTLAYWSRLRMSLLYFYYISGDEANWILFTATDSVPAQADNEVLELKNHFKIKKYSPPSKESVGLEVSKSGTFTVDERCTFSTIEVRSPRIKLPNLPLLGNAVRTKSQAVTKDYFLKNTEKGLWLCFYDNSSLHLLRANERKMVNIEMTRQPQ
jgi:hypothetical protein